MCVSHQLVKQFKQFKKTVVRTVNLSVDVKREKYYATCNNYGIIDNYLKSGPKADNNSNRNNIYLLQLG